MEQRSLFGLGSVIRRRRISQPSVVGSTISALCKVESNSGLSLERAVERYRLRSAMAWEQWRTALEQVFQRDPKRITKGCHHHVSFDARLMLMEQGSDRKLVLQRSECGFGLG